MKGGGAEKNLLLFCLSPRFLHSPPLAHPPPSKKKREGKSKTQEGPLHPLSVSFPLRGGRKGRGGGVDDSPERKRKESPRAVPVAKMDPQRKKEEGEGET